MTTSSPSSSRWPLSFWYSRGFQVRCCIGFIPRGLCPISRSAIFLSPSFRAPLSPNASPALLALGALQWFTSLTISFTYVHLNPDGLTSINTSTAAFWLYVLKYSPLIHIPEFLIGLLAGQVSSTREDLPRPPRQTVFSLLVPLRLSYSAVLLLGNVIPYPVTHTGPPSRTAAGRIHPESGQRRVRRPRLAAQMVRPLGTIQFCAVHYCTPRYGTTFFVFLGSFCSDESRFQICGAGLHRYPVPLPSTTG